MKPNIALENYNLLMKLKPSEKLMCGLNNQLQLDERYLKGVRRTITGDSRDRLLSVLCETLETVNVPNIRKLQLISKLKLVLSQTYADYPRLSDTIAELFQKYNHADGRMPNGTIASIPPVCLNQTKLMEIRHSGRISDNVWKVLYQDMWISGAVCDFILNYPSPNALFDIYIHKVGVNCGLTVIDPELALKTTEYVNSNSAKRL